MQVKLTQIEFICINGNLMLRLSMERIHGCGQPHLDNIPQNWKQDIPLQNDGLVVQKVIEGPG